MLPVCVFVCCPGMNHELESTRRGAIPVLRIYRRNCIRNNCLGVRLFNLCHIRVVYFDFYALPLLIACLSLNILIFRAYKPTTMVYPPLIKSASKAMLLARLNWDAHNPAHQAVYLQMKVTVFQPKKKKEKKKRCRPK